MGDELKDQRVDFRESVAGLVREAKDAEGRTWDAVIIQSGLSKNGRFYPDEVLLKSAKLFEGARCYAYEFKGNYLDHLPDFAKAAMPEGFARNLVGWFENVRFDEFIGADGKARTGLVAAFHCTDDRVRQTFLNAWKEGKRDLLGFSIDVEGTINRVWMAGQLADQVESIERVTSVDVVSVPAAGGQVVRLLASNGGGMKDRILELIKQHNPQLLEGLDLAAITEDQAWELLGKLLEGVKEALHSKDEELKKKTLAATESLIASVLGPAEKLTEIFKGDRELLEKAAAWLAGRTVESACALLEGVIGKHRSASQQAGNGQTPDPKAAAQVREALSRAKEAEEHARKTSEELALMKAQQTLTESLAAEKDLPEVAKTQIRKQFAGRVFEAKELQEAVKEHKEYLGALAQSGEVDGLGSQVKAGLQESDKLQLALDLMLGYHPTDAEKPQYQGIRPFRGLREAFHAFSRYDIADDGRLSEAQSRRVREATTADFSFALGVSMTRKLVKEYSRLPYDWRKLAAVVPVDNFKQQERIRWGGLGVLPDVSESATADYPELTFPTDERATYTPKKKGGLITITREMILNDDLGILRRLPTRIAVAANRQLNRFVFDLLLSVDANGAINAGTVYDGLALYHANHLNNLAVALSYANLVTARQKLFGMPEYGTKSTIAAALAAAATSIAVAAGDGKKFKAGDYAQIDAEILEITAVSTDTLTIVRGKFGTTDAAHSSGATIYQIVEPQLGLTLKYLVVPIELENTARILRDSERTPGGNLNDINTLRGLFEVLTSPFLRGDANNWYAVADPGQLDLIEVGFVEGREEPVILLQDQPTVGNVFARDNIRYKVRHEYGGAVIDFRGFVGSLVA
ncbi:MAG: hypothetical protein HY600_05560 [Candidatus Omnitrophica bacterium]|nr:hypothetical protein [Candidatus Omnitrophota bacterium]